MIDRLEATLKRYNDISEELANPSIVNDIKKMTELSKEQNRLEEVVNVYKRYKEVVKGIEEDKELIHDSELGEIAKEELSSYEKEKSEILEMIGDQKYKIDRSKGLGENDPEMMSLTTMNPATRRLIKVTPTNMEATANMFDLLLGDNLQGRKDFIAEYGNQYLELADIS